MTAKVSKAVRLIRPGTSGSEIIRTINQGILDAQNQIYKVGGVILPLCTVKIVVEQEFEDNQNDD